jgi:hypothetical protein
MNYNIREFAPGFSPELELMMICLSRSLGKDITVKINASRPDAIHWPLFLDLVVRHRVTPVIHKTLPDLVQHVPEHVVGELRREYRRNAKRALRLSAETVRLIKLLKENGIHAIPLKGTMLALRLHGDMSARYAGDLDLLIDPADMDRADLVIRKFGYARKYPVSNISSTQKALFKRHFCAFEYKSAQAEIKLELHSRLTSSYLIDFPFDYLKREGRNIVVGGQQIPVLPEAEEFLFLCAHGSLHRWYRLFWLYDVAVYIDHCHGKLDWEEVCERARLLGIRRPFLLGCVMCHLLFNTPLPVPVRISAEKEALLPELMDTSLKSIIAEHRYRITAARFVEFKLFQSRLRSDAFYKLNLHLTSMLGPSDWEVVKLPSFFLPFYLFLRPFLWAARRKKKPF